MRVTAVLTTLALASSFGSLGCRPTTPRARYAWIATGVTTTVVGGLLLASARSESEHAQRECESAEHQGELFCGLGAGLGSAFLAMLVLPAGMTMTIGGAVARVHEDPEAPAAAEVARDRGARLPRSSQEAVAPQAFSPRWSSRAGRGPGRTPR